MNILYVRESVITGFSTVNSQGQAMSVSLGFVGGKWRIFHPEYMTCCTDDIRLGWHTYFFEKFIFIVSVYSSPSAIRPPGRFSNPLMHGGRDRDRFYFSWYTWYLFRRVVLGSRDYSWADYRYIPCSTNFCILFLLRDGLRGMSYQTMSWS